MKRDIANLTRLVETSRQRHLRRSRAFVAWNKGHGVELRRRWTLVQEAIALRDQLRHRLADLEDADGA